MTTIQQENEARMQAKVTELRRRILATGTFGADDVLPDGAVIRFDLRYHEDKAGLYTHVAVKKAGRWYPTGRVFEGAGWEWEDLLAAMVKDHRVCERIEIATKWEVLG